MPLSRRTFLETAAIAGLTSSLSRSSHAAPPAEGPFQPTWESLAQYRAPEWFRDAKFGIWAHWGPQCVPGQGDWYARQMYQEGNHDYRYQCDHYGHPSRFGFKDVIHLWRAEAWDPDHLLRLYKRAGAKYFMCLANHHDNFDNYASTHQPWNSVAIGPKKDLVGGWAKATREAGLRFAVSVHASHAWSWYETAQGADKQGPWAGVPYDGHLTKAEGKGQWWDGLDPQELYTQNHGPMGLQWEWQFQGRGELPSAAYIEKFYRRTIELIDKYQPDQVYFDDTVLPFHPISDAGLRIAAHMYNDSIRRHRGRLEAVINGKVLNDEQRKCMVMDLERGVSNRIESLPWQTDTCLGNWHYDINLFNRHGYKTPDQVAHMLVDIVSKNGNLMLNVPLPGSGMPDTDEFKFLEDFTKWMDVNSAGIYGSRPWKVAVEGPSGAGSAVRAQGFNERNQRYTAQDFRFTTKGDILFAYAMHWPDDGKLVVRSLAQGAGRIEDVQLLGHRGKLAWTQTAEGLAVTLPGAKPCDYVYGLRIRGRGLTPVPVTLAPIIVKPRADGAIVLDASRATIHGDTPQVETKNGVDDVGYWGNATDYVSWDFDAPAAGTYHVSVDYACEPGAAGSGFVIEVGGQSVSGITASTGSWNEFTAHSLGTLTLAQAGKQTLTFKPQAGTSWHAIALRGVTLTKA